MVGESIIKSKGKFFNEKKSDILIPFVDNTFSSCLNNNLLELIELK